MSWAEPGVAGSETRVALLFQVRNRVGAVKGIVCLSGSTRFRDLFELVNAELTKAGWVVLSVGTFNRAEYHVDTEEARRLKAALDRLHFDKIDLAQALVALNGTLDPARHEPGDPLGNIAGYIGASTGREVAHGREGGKPVFWWDLGAAVTARVNRGGAASEPWDWEPGDRSWLDLLPEGHPLRKADAERRDAEARAYREAADGQGEGEGPTDQEPLA